MYVGICAYKKPSKSPQFHSQSDSNEKELWEEKPDSIDTNSIGSDLPWNEGCEVVETVTRLDKKSFVQIFDWLLFFLKWKKMFSIERGFIGGRLHGEDTWRLIS